MQKGYVDENPPAPARSSQAESAPQLAGRSRRSDLEALPAPAAEQPSSPAQPGLASAGPKRPRSHRELGEAILDSGDPVRVGRELLDKSDDRGAPTRLRSLETFAGWAFGKSGAEGVRKPPRIIWDIPGPPYEPADPELEKLEGGEK